MNSILVDIQDFFNRSLGFFDSRGLRHSTRKLERIWPEITQWPIELQADYVDIVTHRGVTDVDFLIQAREDSLRMLRSGLGPDVLSQFNSTSVGNLAYQGIYAGREFHNPQKIRLAEDVSNLSIKILQILRTQFKQTV